jgi:hypothetical protein
MAFSISEARTRKILCKICEQVSVFSIGGMASDEIALDSVRSKHFQHFPQIIHGLLPNGSAPRF